MITCRRAAELISQELDTDLRFHQRIVLRFHKLACGGCRRFWRQIVAVDAAVEEFFAQSRPGDAEATLPATSKVQLKLLIDQRLDEES